MNGYTPYTYLIGWSTNNKWYYGSRTAKTHKCLYTTGYHPDDLFNTYFTSSKEVKRMIEEFGNPDIIQIRKTFPNNPKKALRWEGKVLKHLKIGIKDKWINKGYLNDVPNSWAPLTKEMRTQRGKIIAKSQIDTGVHNFLKSNRTGKMGNEFDSESSKNLAIQRMTDKTNYFCNLCCVDESGNVIWVEKEKFLEQKHTKVLVMNSSNEGKRRLMEWKHGG